MIFYRGRDDIARVLHAAPIANRTCKHAAAVIGRELRQLPSPSGAPLSFELGIDDAPDTGPRCCKLIAKETAQMPLLDSVVDKSGGWLRKMQRVTVLGNAVRLEVNSAAAPATVGGEFSSAYATGAPILAHREGRKKTFEPRARRPAVTSRPSSMRDAWWNGQP
jgi:hypothetical protein